MTTAKAVLNDLADRLRAAFPGQVKDVILFGSRLTGEAREDSDYDFVLVWKGQQLHWAQKSEISSICYETDLKFNVVTHTLIISEEELTGLRGLQPIYQNALKFGARAA